MTSADRPACDAAREWLSAARDGEALDDPTARAHVASCTACANWASTLDRLTPRLRIRPAGDTPDVVAAAMAVWRRREASGKRWQVRAGRVLVGVAGAAGLVLAAVGVVGLPGDLAASGAHQGWELHSFEAALAFGFLLAARRPRRYTRPLLPLVAAVSALILAPSAAALTATGADPLGEASHLAVLVGLVGLLMLFDTQRRAGGLAAGRRPA